MQGAYIKILQGGILKKMNSYCKVYFFCINKYGNPIFASMLDQHQ